MFGGAKLLLGLAALVALAGCASDWEGKYGELQQEHLNLVAERDDLRQRQAEAVSQQEAMAQQIQAQENEIKRARDRADEAARRAQELANANAAPAPVAKASSGDIDNEARRLQGELGNANKVRVTPDGNIEITLDSDVTFASGEATLTEAGKKSLKTIAPVLKGRFGPYQIRVEGHTDSEPLKRTKAKWGDNFGLGSARSLEVVRYMESSLGIEPTRLMSASRGEHEPVASESSKDGKKANRRVEIVVVIPGASALSMAK